MDYTGIAYLIDGTIVKISIPTNKNKNYSHENDELYNALSKVNNILVHRDNKPAIIWNSDYWIDKNWYINNGKLHRLDGPAKYGIKDFPFDAFFINGKNMERLEWAKETNHLLCNKCNDFCSQQCFIY